MHSNYANNTLGFLLPPGITIPHPEAVLAQKLPRRKGYDHLVESERGEGLDVRSLWSIIYMMRLQTRF